MTLLLLACLPVRWEVLGTVEGPAIDLQADLPIQTRTLTLTADGACFPEGSEAEHSSYFDGEAMITASLEPGRWDEDLGDAAVMTMLRRNDVVLDSKSTAFETESDAVIELYAGDWTESCPDLAECVMAFTVELQLTSGLSAAGGTEAAAVVRGPPGDDEPVDCSLSLSFE